ncbi:dihydrofolate reductase family protein [Actinophytocola oryzae]|uniref:Dihydrofolate reductase n=1 Tax=Actinophytocola oryzae TaxID=502181 RepID=A0A4R7URP6_9PSEU|nr:dihydrofolate reductase family protein [Actinophytocola oryzae]TDV37549.1 dihydrofolate reductase [Actinophytocola oryzae]
MSTIAINMFVSLDGVAQAPGGPKEDVDGDFGHGGWTVPYFTEQVGDIVGPWHASAGALLLGRRTYDIFAAYWPHVPDGHEEAPMAKILNNVPKYVASRSKPSLTWENSSLLDGDVPAAVAELKRQDLGEVVVVGSLDLAQTLIANDLVDEYRLTVFPVVLGTGKRLFGDGAVPSGLELVSARTTDSGVVGCVYRPVGKPGYGSFEL